MKYWGMVCSHCKDKIYKFERFFYFKSKNQKKKDWSDTILICEKCITEFVHRYKAENSRGEIEITQEEKRGGVERPRGELDYLEVAMDMINRCSSVSGWEREIKESKKLKQFSEEKIKEISEKYVQLVEQAKNRLIERLNAASDEEKEELKLFIIDRAEYMTPEFFKDRDEDYRNLIATICGGNDRGFTNGFCKMCKVVSPFRSLWDKFNKYYRGNPNWDRIKKRAIIKKGRKCEICGGDENIHVHHMLGSYNNDQEVLQILCSDCHIKFHRKYGYKDFGEKKDIR